MECVCWGGGGGVCVCVGGGGGVKGSWVGRDDSLDKCHQCYQTPSALPRLLTATRIVDPRKAPSTLVHTTTTAFFGLTHLCRRGIQHIRK